jgi:hypothetical protein
MRCSFLLAKAKVSGRNQTICRILTIPRDLSARLNLDTSLSLISNVTEGDCPSGTLSGRDWIFGADEVCTTTLMSFYPPWRTRDHRSDRMTPERTHILRPTRASSVFHDRMTRTPNLYHVCQKRLIINDQALLRRLLREPQATRINLGNLERLRTISGIQFSKSLLSMALITDNIRLLWARMWIAWA